MVILLFFFYLEKNSFKYPWGYCLTWFGVNCLCIKHAYFFKITSSKIILPDFGLIFSNKSYKVQTFLNRNTDRTSSFIGSLMNEVINTFHYHPSPQICKLLPKMIGVQHLLSPPNKQQRYVHCEQFC